MQYKGYTATNIAFDEEAGLLHGEVDNLRDVVTFAGRSVAEVKQAFRDSVDDYLAMCAERGEEPEKPYSGKFVVRIEPALHAKIAAAAARQQTSLNNWVLEALTAAVATASSAPPSSERKRFAVSKGSKTAVREKKRVSYGNLAETDKVTSPRTAMGKKKEAGRAVARKKDPR